MQQTEPTFKPPAEIRERLQLIAGSYLPKLPDLIAELATKSEPMVKMAITALRPFLPRLSAALTGAIENAPDDKLQELARLVWGVSEWLKQEELEAQGIENIKDCEAS